MYAKSTQGINLPPMFQISMPLHSHSMGSLHIPSPIFMAKTVLTPSRSVILETMNRAPRCNLRHLIRPAQCTSLGSQLTPRLIMCSPLHQWVSLKESGLDAEELL